MEVKEASSRDFQGRAGSCLLISHYFFILFAFACKAWVGGRKERKRGGQAVGCSPSSRGASEMKFWEQRPAWGLPLARALGKLPLWPPDLGKSQIWSTASPVLVSAACSPSNRAPAPTNEAASDVRGYWWWLLNHIGFSVRVYLLHR